MQVPTPAGYELAARFFEPPPGAPAARAGVLVAPAMGVAQSYYAAFAAWLAGQGYVVATFDYFGIGLSRPRDLRAVPTDILGWARNDCAAMLDALAARAPGLPLGWIGHSLGGQILPFVGNRARLARVVTVASGSGYWRQSAPGLRWRVWWLWYVVVPLAVRAAGYFPGRRLRKVGDVPRRAMEQWRRWCLDPEYAVGVEGPAARAAYAAVDTPLASLSFTDDEYMSERSIAALHAFYTRAPKVMTRLRPADVGERRIGHFGFFRPRYERSLWRPYLLPALP